MSLKNKIDFAVVFTVKNANPNGDPLNGNRPRENYDGLGEVSDVALKRKIRNRLQDAGEIIFVQSDDRANDGFASLRERADSLKTLKEAASKKDTKLYAKAACEQWMDVRSFGQVFAFKADSVSVGVRGPVSVHPAFSVVPVDIESLQITKSVNSETSDKRGSDTMGQKHRINFGLYAFYGSINCQLAENTGFSEADAEKIHQALRTLFDNDASSARPEGSLEICRVIWWTHNNQSGQYPSAKVHRSLVITPKIDNPLHYSDFDINVEPLPGLLCQDELLR